MPRTAALALAILLAATQGSSAQAREASAAGFPATIVLPVGIGKPPIVVFIAGSGPTDRDGNSALGVRAGYLAKLAEGLARHGIASLRFDKRGLQGSRPAGAEESLSVSTFVDDVVAVVDWLPAVGETGPLLLLGHSEGGLIALEAAARRTDVDGIVLLATPGRPAADTLRDQLQALEEPLRRRALAIVADIETGTATAAVPQDLAGLFRPSLRPYLRSLFAVRPVERLRALRLPALVIGGGTDLQVGRADFDALVAARPDVDSRWFAGMNHVLGDVPADRAANLASYNDPGLPLSDGLVDAIAGFISTLPKN